MFDLFDTILPFPYFGPDFEDDSEMSEEGNKYVFTFNFGGKIDPDLLKIRIKNHDKLHVSYHSKTDNNEISIVSVRDIPEEFQRFEWSR